MRKRMPLLAKLAISFGVIVGLSLLAFVVTSQLPTGLEPLREQAPADDLNFGTAAKPAGCALNRIESDQKCLPATPNSVEELEVTFESRLKDKYLPQLKGTLSIPRGLAGPRPGVVLIHGSGPTNRDGDAPGDLIRPNRGAMFPLLKTLAAWLARQGLVVLRYDKRACVKCYPELPWGEIDFSQFRFEDFRDDARDGLKLLAERPEVDPHRLVVIGHSQGGQNAPLVAHGNADVVAVVMLAGTTQTFERGLIGQLERIEDIRLAQFDPLGALEVHLMRRHYQSCFDKLRGEFDPKDGCLGGGVTLAALAAETAVAETTVETIRTLHCPLLAIHGNLDRNIDPEVPKLIGTALEGRNGRVITIDGLGHLLTNLVEPPPKPDFDPAVYEGLRTFLSTVKPAP